MRAVVFANGEVSDYAFVASCLNGDDYLVAADGGAAHCLSLGLTPHLIVGDLDSIAPELLDDFAGKGAVVERHPRAKDETDLELALERALAAGADEVLLVGVTGGRLDQTLANLLILAQRPWSARVIALDGRQLAEVLRGPGEMALHGVPGNVVSAIPLSPTVEGITYWGLEYPLIEATLLLGSTRGVSNVIASAPARIRVERGLLLVVYETTEPAYKIQT